MGDQSVPEVHSIRVSRYAVELAAAKIDAEQHGTPAGVQAASGQWAEVLAANPLSYTFFVNPDGKLATAPATPDVFDLDQGKVYSAKSMGFNL